ncbi:MAG: hypothetical protein M3O67_03900, partial [Bacteroidota bacterium]|nr:hypothetical protein [Bacteroidota bacterium]
YANAEPEKPKATESSPSFLDRLLNKPWFKTFVWIIIIGGFVTVIIWYLAISNVAVFRKAPKNISSADPDAETENIFEINYENEIHKAIRIGNYRLAVRLMFLRLLTNMAQKNIIQYKQERTNFDYLLQLHNTRYYKDFFRLTRNYEYTWYGKFDVSNEAFTIIKNDFEKFNHKLVKPF